MKYLVSSLLVSAAMACTEAEFVEYITKFGKSYETREEYDMRFWLFHNTTNAILKLNKNGTSFHAHNKYSDWMHSEYMQLLGYLGESNNHKEKSEEVPTYFLPESVDWRTVGAVSAVKDQGTCGSCYAFSAIGSLEGAWFIKTGDLVEFSVQNAVDCSQDYENYGCMGGWQENVYDYSFWYPIMTEKEYPYLGRDSFCAWEQPGTVYADQTHTVPYGKPDQLKAAIAQTPTAVTIDAGDAAFQTYSSGVITANCGKKLNHAVLAVGYGTENGQEYFLVKNSWGSDWGDDGYVKIGIVEGDDICGILQHSLYPTVKGADE